MMEVRERCRQTLTAAAQSGKLRVSMEQLATDRCSSTRAEQIKEKTRNALLDAAVAGRLGDVMASIRDEVDRDDQLARETMVLARNELAYAAWSGRLDIILESVKQDSMREQRESMSTGDMQAALASQLSFAAETGALTEILRSVSTHHPEPSRAAEADMEGIRRRIQHSFKDSCQNGSFAAALRDAQQDELRVDAKAGRTQAPEEGADVDAMRSRLQQTFSGAIAEGTMESALQACQTAKAKPFDLCDIESAVRQALEAAAEDGSLGSLLQRTRDEQHDGSAGAATGAADAGDAAAATAEPSEVDAAVVRIQSIQRGRCARREAARVQREQHVADAGGLAAEEARGAGGEPDGELVESIREQVWSGMQECLQSGRLEEWFKSRPSSRGNAAAKAPRPPASEQLVPAEPAPGADAWALFQLVSNANRRVGLLQATIRDVERRIEAMTTSEEQLRADLQARREEGRSLEAELIGRQRTLMEQEGLHWKLKDKKRKLFDKISLENLQHKYDAELDSLRSQSTVATLRDQDLRGPSLAGGGELLT